MSESRTEDSSVSLQIKVFTRWVKSHLGSDRDTVNTITKDLSNGVALVLLAENLTNTTENISWRQDPKRTVDEVMNCELALKMFQKDGVKIIGISGKDINDNNEKLILGLIWSLILHYSINTIRSDGKDNNSTISANKKQILLQWAYNRTSNYPHIEKFKPYDLAICALLDSYIPNKIQFEKLNKDDVENNLKTANNAMTEFDIPVYILPQDLCDREIDDKILLTQLAAIKNTLDNPSKLCEIKEQNAQVITNAEAEAQKNIENLSKQLKETKEAAKQQADADANTISDKNGEIQRLNEELAVSIERENESRKTLEKEKSLKKSELSHMQTQIDEKTDENQELQQKLADSISKNEKLSENMKTLQVNNKSEVDSLNQKIQVQLDDSKKDKSTIQQLTGNNDSLTSKLAQINDEKTMLNNKIHNLSTELEQKRHELTECQMQNAELSRKLADSISENNKLTDRSIQVESENDDLKIRNDQLNKAIEPSKMEVIRIQILFNELMEKYMKIKSREKAILIVYVPFIVILCLIILIKI